MASPTLYGRVRLSGYAQIKPQAVPQSTTIIAPSDALLLCLSITNTTAGAVTFTLSDRQASAIDFMTAVSIPANTTVLVVMADEDDPSGAQIWLPGGFTVAAGGSGLNYWAAWKQ